MREGVCIEKMQKIDFINSNITKNIFAIVVPLTMTTTN